MALYEVAQQTKKTLKIGIVLIIIAIILKISFNTTYYIYINYINPPKPPVPEVCYGKINQLKLNSLPLKEGSNPTYRLDTITGKFPPIPDRAPVYKLKQIAATISVERNAEEFAKNMGFTSKRKEESALDWLWEDKNNGQTLMMNIITGKFELETDLVKLSKKAPTGSAPTPQEAVNAAQKFLTQHNLLNDSLLSATTSSRYINIQGNQLRLAKDKDVAQMAEISFFLNLTLFTEDYPGFNTQELPSNLPVMQDSPDEGAVIIYVSGSEFEKYKFPTIHYQPSLIDEGDRCTYPIKTISTAWEELTTGQGIITKLRLVESDPYTNYILLNIAEIQIMEIKLAFIESGKTNNKYLQPIFVFEGEAKTAENERARYVAYLPAIDAHCLSAGDDIGIPCSQ